MNFIDLHCDTLSKLVVTDQNENLKDNTLCVSIPEMRKAKTEVQLFACYTYLPEFAESGYDGCYGRVHEMIDCMEKQTEQFPDEIAIAMTYESLKENKEAGKISAVLTVEEGGILNGKMERLEALYERGIRVITPMWNYENCLGYPNSRDAETMQKGLKPFGKEVIENMSMRKMIVDVSHASDGTFWDILEQKDCMVIASHSNCRTLCNHPRNLSDDMIRALAERGGVSGLNFYGTFLGKKKESRVEEMVAHLLHMIQVGGSEFPAIGTDFDGFSGMLVEDIPKVGMMERLWNALKKKGISETQIEKIWSENARRVLKNIS